jgi:hypothetical protein
MVKTKDLDFLRDFYLLVSSFLCINARYIDALWPCLIVNFCKTIFSLLYS